MTLGDRLAVMRDGVLQQVGTPDELYNHPRNVFVAGFIGAPAMNFLPGEITSGSLKFGLATIPLDDVRNGGERVTQSDGRVLVGIRPEDFEDAALAGERGHGIRIKAMIDVLESTGSDRYAHLAAGEHNGSHELNESLLRELKAMAIESGDDITPTSLDVIARVDASSRLGEGKEGELWLDSTKLHLFDPATGERLES
jgi:multiple sugar transport system ATP-binding protein